MTAEPEPTLSWPVLSLQERRVLGVLVEKAKTTPDTYPLSLNALVTGCNQKSNRDPVMELTAPDVEEALSTAQQKGLVSRITGGRVERWRHHLYESWRVDKVELAVLAELLLRGPQTEGELRSRASRMEPIADLEALRTVLKILAQRGLVVYLTPEGRRGTIVTHGFHPPDELERLRAKLGKEGGGAAEDHGPASMPAAATPEWNSRLAEARSELETFRGSLVDLQARVAHLEQQVRGLMDSLGVT